MDHRRVQLLARRPPLLSLRGQLRVEMEDLRRVLAEELAVMDDELARLVSRRRELVELLQGCDLALAGSGCVPLADGGFARLFRRRREVFDDPLPSRQPLHGPATPTLVRDRAVALLQACGELSVGELRRLLQLEGLDLGDGASKLVANALRLAVRRGVVAHVGRGRYAPVARRADRAADTGDRPAGR